MATNFEHLKGENTLYEKMIYVEDLIVDGTRKEDYISAIDNMRKVLDIMMKRWVQKAGLSDNDVKAALTRRNKDSGSVNLYSRIIALSDTNMVDSGIIDELQNIRMSGNKTVHGDDNMSSDEAYKHAVSLYSKMYKCTYYYINFTPVAQTSKSGFSFFVRKNREQSSSAQPSPEPTTNSQTVSDAKSSSGSVKLGYDNPFADFQMPQTDSASADQGAKKNKKRGMTRAVLWSPVIFLDVFLFVCELMWITSGYNYSTISRSGLNVINDFKHRYWNNVFPTAIIAGVISLLVYLSFQKKKSELVRVKKKPLGIITNCILLLFATYTLLRGIGLWCDFMIPFSYYWNIRFWYGQQPLIYSLREEGLIPGAIVCLIAVVAYIIDACIYNHKIK